MASDIVSFFLRFFLTEDPPLRTIYTSYSNRPSATPEILSQETETEQFGYKKLSEQVADMIAAGERLEHYRRTGDAYDFNSLDDSGLDGYDDPTRAPGYDFDDLHADVMATRRSLEAMAANITTEQAQAAENKPKKRKKKAVEEEELEDDE